MVGTMAASTDLGACQIIWSRLEPKPQKPRGVSPLSRYGHAAEFSSVCSLGYSIEEGVRAGKIVLETLLVRDINWPP